VSYKVAILPRAESDFLQIYSYIEERSSIGAAGWREAFEKSLVRLVDNPNACGIAP